MTICEYADGAGNGSNPTTWNHHDLVRDWFAALPNNATVQWTNHYYAGGRWVLDEADIVVPAVEHAAPFNWLWTITTRTRRIGLDEWQLVVRPDITVWRLDVDGLLAYASQTDPSEITQEQLTEARALTDRDGPQVWRRTEAISHARLNRVQQDWVTQHCGRADVAFEYREDLVGRFGRTILDRTVDLGPGPEPRSVT